MHLQFQLLLSSALLVHTAWAVRPGLVLCGSHFPVGVSSPPSVCAAPRGLNEDPTRAGLACSGVPGA